MNERPLIISLLIGFIVVLVIAGVSLLVKMNSLSDLYKKELANNMSSQKMIETLNEEKVSLTRERNSLQEESGNLKKEVAQLNFQAEELKGEVIKLEKLKDKLEENLKEELIKPGSEEN